MAAVTFCRYFRAQENKVCHYFHFFPIYLPWSDGTEFFWVLTQFCFFFPLSFFILIKGLFSSSLSAKRVASSVYLRLLIFLLAILIPAHASSRLAFHLIYSTYKLNKQDEKTQPWHTSFPILNLSVAQCPILTVASWPAKRFHRRQ